MKINEINIRDPFVLFENGKYYMYGTRGKNFGQKTGGFDVYVSTDLENWSEPIECFNSEKYNMNSNVNWAPEVHKYKDAYYMFATFTKPNGLRGTYILKSDTPLGEFKPHSKSAVILMSGSVSMVHFMLIKKANHLLCFAMSTHK
jgi:beta-xylosidase